MALRDTLYRAMRFVRTSRGAWITGIATVVVLAAVIMIGGALAPDDPRESSGPGTPAALSAEIDNLIANAETLAASGETTSAQMLLAQVLEREPSNAKARELMARVTPSPEAPSDATLGDADSPGNAQDPPGEGGELPQSAGYLEPRADLAPLLPPVPTGYQAEQQNSNSETAVLTVSPIGGAAHAADVRRVLFTVYDMGSEQAAQAFVSGQVKAYPVQDKSVTIRSVTGRFGADTGTFAAVSFSRGRFAFEVLLTVQGVSPAQLEAHASELAAGFSASE